MASASPAFSAMGTPYSTCIADRPRRCSLPSSMSSWIRNAAWSSSTAAADRQRVLERAAEGLARGEAEGRAQPLSLPHGERAHRVVEMAARLARGQVLGDELRRRDAVPLDGRLDRTASPPASQWASAALTPDGPTSTRTSMAVPIDASEMRTP